MIEFDEAEYMLDIKVGSVLVCKRLNSIYYSSKYYQKYTGNFTAFPSTIGEKVIIEKIVDDSNIVGGIVFAIISNNRGKWNFPIESLHTYFDTLQDHRRKIIDDLI